MARGSCSEGVQAFRCQEKGIGKEHEYVLLFRVWGLGTEEHMYSAVLLGMIWKVVKVVGPFFGVFYAYRATS